MKENSIVKYKIYGIVQGIGFRPLVAKIASELNMGGFVRNTIFGAEIFFSYKGSQLAASFKNDVERFFTELHLRLPKEGKIIKTVKCESIPKGDLVDINKEVKKITEAKKEKSTKTIKGVGDKPKKLCDKSEKKGGYKKYKEGVKGKNDEHKNVPHKNLPKPQQNFIVLPSNNKDKNEPRMIPFDIGICEDCLRELDESDNKRYKHALISCYKCGPRLSILKDFPYDRKNTSMNKFPMCLDCEQEYTDIKNRRYHAQTISCPSCAPFLIGVFKGREKESKDFDSCLPKNNTKQNSLSVISDSPLSSSHTAHSLSTSHTTHSLSSSRRRGSTPDTVSSMWNMDSYLHSNNAKVSKNDKSEKKKDIKHNKNNATVSEKNYDEEILEKAKKVLRAGGILLIKGTSGYHLVCDPKNEKAVKRLREIKNRDEKPFAIMIDNNSNVIKNKKQRDLLMSPKRPIVLFRKDKVDISFSKTVIGNSNYIGLLFPSTGYQKLLVKDKPLIFTSANISDEPVLYDDKNAMNFFKAKNIDGMIFNNREILIGQDDSVIYESGVLVRRSKGYAPLAIQVDIEEYINSNLRGRKNKDALLKKIETEMRRDILAAGADLKSSFAFMKNSFIYLSEFIGELGDNLNVSKKYLDSLEKFRKLFNFNPKSFSFDLHPNYFSTEILKEFFSLNNLKESNFSSSQKTCSSICNKKSVSFSKSSTSTSPSKNSKSALLLDKKISKINTKNSFALQHHKAHLLSVIAEHNLLNEEIFGFSFDGVGYGEDENIWGGEVFRIDKNLRFKRVNHLKEVEIYGGDLASKEGYLPALSYLSDENYNKNVGQRQDALGLYSEANLSSKSINFTQENSNEFAENINLASATKPQNENKIYTNLSQSKKNKSDKQGENFSTIDLTKIFSYYKKNYRSFDYEKIITDENFLGEDNKKNSNENLEEIFMSKSDKNSEQNFSMKSSMKNSKKNSMKNSPENFSENLKNNINENFAKVSKENSKNSSKKNFSETQKGKSKISSNKNLSNASKLNSSQVLSLQQKTNFISIENIFTDQQSYTSSSMGRLFDAISYLLGVSEKNLYEGYSAMMLEKVALNEKTLRGKLALNFHKDIIKEIEKIIEDEIKNSGIKKFVFSGGVFLNQILYSLLLDLENKLLKKYFISSDKNLGGSLSCNSNSNPCNSNSNSKIKSKINSNYNSNYNSENNTNDSSDDNSCDNSNYNSADKTSTIQKNQTSPKTITPQHASSTQGKLFYFNKDLPFGDQNVAVGQALYTKIQNINKILGIK